MADQADNKPVHQVVIIGGGFGGLYAAKSLAKANVQITLIDKRNFHLFQPLLYQVATGALSPADISSPLRSVLSKSKNSSFHQVFTKCLHTALSTHWQFFHTEIVRFGDIN